MILDIDCGNTRCKWRICDANGQTLDSGKADSLESLLADTAMQHPLQRVRVSSVRDRGFMTELAERLESGWGLRLECARVQRECAGVTVSYADPGRLGVDRWLAMLAAYQDGPGAAVVIDCGTALTLDLLHSSGRHAGGYIVPGLRLAYGALTANTGIRLSHGPVWATEPGNSTEDAVYRGVFTMVVALIEKVVNEGCGNESVPLVYQTGGDATELLPYLNFPDRQIRLKPDLVLDGLALALP